MLTQENSIWDKRLVLSFPLEVNLFDGMVNSFFLHGMDSGCSHCMA